MTTGSDADQTHDLDVEEYEAVNSAEERLVPNLRMSNLGPRPLRHPDTQLPIAVLKASACETLLDAQSKNCTTTLTKTKNLATMASTSTTISSVNVTTNKDGAVLATAIESKTSISVLRQPKFHAPPPPPPPRRLLLMQNKPNVSGAIATTQSATRRTSGTCVDGGSQVDAIDGRSNVTGIHFPKKERTNVKNSLTIIETSLLDSDTGHQLNCSTSTTALRTTNRIDSTAIRETIAHDLTGLNLSPRIEMRLALNHDVMADEDFMCYNPGPHLTTILGHDLSTFQRLTGRDLLNRSVSQLGQVREAAILCSQQRNSKMDTPTVNRRPRPSNASRIEVVQQQQQQQQQAPMSLLGLGGGSARVGGVPQHLQPNRNTWSSSVSVVQSGVENAVNVVDKKIYSENCNTNNLSDLERLARREMIYSMSQSKSGSPQVKTTIATTILGKNKDLLANHHLTRSASAKSMNSAEGDMSRTGREERGNRLMNFLKRRNSEISNSASAQCSQSSASNKTETNELAQSLSPRKDVDKPSLNRRLWKQITRRRRASSMSEIVASS